MKTEHLATSIPGIAHPLSPGGYRLAYLDWLKFLVVLSLAPFHAAISFSGVGSTYVYDTPVRDILLAGSAPATGVGPLVFAAFVSFMDNWSMHLLFLISGIGAAFSLRKRNAAQFLGERCNRLTLPLSLGTIFLISFQSWLRALSVGHFSGSFFAFFPKFFNGVNTGLQSSGNFDWGHFWFLGYLFVFSVIALPLFLSIRKKSETSRILAAARRFAVMPYFLLPALWLGILEGLFRPGWPGSLNLVNDWAVFTVNFSFLLMGYLMGAVPELQQAVEKYRLPALILGLSAYFARITIYQLVSVPGGYNALNIIASVLRGLAAYGLVMAAMGYGRRNLKGQGRMLGIARDLSFPLYVLHYAPLVATTYLLLNTGQSIWTRWILAVVASWSFVVLFTFIARYIPVLRRFFGIRQPESTILHRNPIVRSP